MNKALVSWQKFWFDATSAAPLGVFRVLFGLVMLVNLLGQYLPFYDYFYGERALISWQSTYAYKWHLGNESLVTATGNLRAPVFDLMIFLPNSDLVFHLFFCLTLLFALFMTVGFFTRTSCVLLFFFLLSLNNHCPFTIHAGDNYARLVVLFMCFSNSGAVLSVDAFLKKREFRDVLIEPLCMRMIQVQFCFIYLVNWLYKLSGPAWNEGSAVYYATRLLQYFRFDYPWFMDNMMASKVLSWSTLVIEFSLIFLLWPKKTKYYMIVLGVLFHLSLDAFFNLGVFEWFFVVTFVLFVEPHVLINMGGRLLKGDYGFRLGKKVEG